MPWESELLEDMHDHMAEYVKSGKDSRLLKDKATEKNVELYLRTFLRLMNKNHPNMRECGRAAHDDFMLVAFSFSRENGFLPELGGEEWRETLLPLISKEKSETLRTQRVVRIYTGDTLIIAKPNRLRYWIRSAAIRDADDVIGDILEGKV